jgi:hypothetical protein
MSSKNKNKTNSARDRFKVEASINEAASVQVCMSTNVAWNVTTQVYLGLLFSFF